MLRILSITSILLAATLASAAETYQFPEGVPVDAAKVTWYKPTDHYQHNGSVHVRSYNISAAKPFEKFGNGNYELPWKTGGIDDSPNASGYKFYQLPPGGTVAYWRQPGGARVTGNVHWSSDPQLVWRYPTGTMFGELLLTDGHAFEVRTMSKGADGQWAFKVYRPYASRDEVAGLIQSERWRRGRLANRHPVRVIDERALENEVDLKPGAAEQVLARPFRDVTDVPWFKSAEGEKCWAPSAGKPGGIAPVKYQGHFLHGKSCKVCHDTVGKHVNAFEVGRDWYGSVRGSDSVFSFSIFDDACAARNGFNQPVRLDPALAGVLRQGR